MKIFNSQFKSALFFLLMSFSFLKAQTTFQWARKMGNNSQNDLGKSIALDAFGNVYTTGSFMGTVDFDPGPGTYSLTSIGNRDAYISKFDANGNFIWAKQFGGFASFSGLAVGNGITVDALGNIYTTGEFFYTVDFDPGPGVSNLSTSGGNYDVYISKLDANGDFIWAKQIGGNQNEEVYSVDSDNSNNVYITGAFDGTVDFDPGAGTYTLSAPGGYILKLDASGNFSLARNICNGTCTGLSVKVDGAGNIYTTGAFSGATVDFDTGPGTFNMSDFGGADAFIQKISSTGNFIWAKQLGGSGSEQGTALSVDASGNVLTTGYFQNTADFDPGVGTFNISSFGSNLDIYVSKLDASGNFVWAKQLGGTQQDQPGAIDLDGLNNVYVTGAFGGTADFDPSASSYTLNSIGGNAIFISKLDASGNFVSGDGFSYSNSMGRGIVVSPYYDIYTTGNFDQTTDFDPGAGTYTLAGSGTYDIFVHKLGQPGCPTFSINSTSNSYTLMCSLNTLTLNSVNTSTISGVTYTWTSPTATGASYTVSAPGIYTVTASAPTNTCLVTQLVSVIQTTGNISYTVNTTSSTCNNNGSATLNIGSGAAPFTYTWSTTNTASVVTGLAPGNYSVTVTDANQCTNTQTFAISNDAPTFSSVPICFVTVDSLSQHNVIVWDKTLFPTADTFFVYRETGTNVYQLIQKQPYSALSKFVDTVKTLYFPNTGNPNVGTYRYKMKTKDNCNNMSNFTPYHNTLFMVNNNGTFSWTQLYQIEGDPNPVLAYILERDDMSNGNWGAIGSVAGTQQFVIDPNYSNFVNTASWRVKTQWNINCTPSKSSSPANSSSYSNRVTNNNVGLKKESINNLISIYPNPSNGIIQISSKIKMNQFEVTNALGVKIYSGEGDISIIDLSKEANGIYFIKLTANNQTMVKKVVITK